MKKFLASILFLFFLISFALSVYADETSVSKIYDYDELNIEVIFDDNTVFNDEQQQKIADILALGKLPVESRAWCWLTGHDYISDAVLVITHEARTLSPRCLQQTYEVTTCENCSYYNEELLGSHYIVCCPEE